MGVFSIIRSAANVSFPILALYAVSSYCTAQLFLDHVADWATVSGPSMHPTMTDDRTVVIINKRCRYGRNCKVGDIIQFSSPIDTAERRSAKRILGMPGDYVVLDKNQDASVGGVKGPWTADQDLEKEREEPRIIQVPEGHVWVAGDNQAYSRDSRYYGPVPMGLIIGRIDYNIQKFMAWTSFRGDQLVIVDTEEVD